MRALLVSLLGMAVIMAIFAGIHYSQGTPSVQEEVRPAFVLAPGEVRSTALQPSLAGSVILVELRIRGGPIDIYVMDDASAATLPHGGVIALDRPFTYDAAASRLGVAGEVSITLISDGETTLDILLDNSDAYYDGDAVPTGEVTVEFTSRYVAEEKRSLLLGYLATIPCVLLVAVTATRQVRRRLRDRHGRQD